MLTPKANRFTRVFVTGGAGYIGSLLVPRLLDRGYMVTSYDISYYGDDFLPKDNPRLTVLQGDIRDVGKMSTAVRKHDAFINLACISNDASFELDERLSTSVNLDAFEPTVLAAKSAGIKRFIFASSSSVYGISDQPNVTEEHPLFPLTLYNKYKGMCEPLLFKHTTKDFVGVAFRPATVCGYAPRQRLDLSVNILTNHAITNGRITVFGGKQLRPNLHIADYCEAVQVLLDAPDEKIANEIFNVGYQNMSIMDIALLVKRVVEQEFPEKGNIEIVTTPSDDNRSYHINSDKIRRILGFAPKRSIEDAVRDLCVAFRDGRLPNPMTDDIYYNVRRMKRLCAA
jgi:nucleoside-diphosphate-sugar epimerase